MTIYTWSAGTASWDALDTWSPTGTPNATTDQADITNPGAYAITVEAQQTYLLGALVLNAVGAVLEVQGTLDSTVPTGFGTSQWTPLPSLTAGGPRSSPPPRCGAGRTARQASRYRRAQRCWSWNCMAHRYPVAPALQAPGGLTGFEPKLNALVPRTPAVPLQPGTARLRTSPGSGRARAHVFVLWPRSSATPGSPGVQS